MASQAKQSRIRNASSSESDIRFFTDSGPDLIDAESTYMSQYDIFEVDDPFVIEPFHLEPAACERSADNDAHGNTDNNNNMSQDLGLTLKN